SCTGGAAARISSAHASEAPLPLGLVAAGVCQPGPGPAGRVPARPADGAVRAAVGVRGGARVGAAASSPARGSALRPDDPRLAGGPHGGAACEVDGDLDDARVGRAAGGEAAGRRAPLVAGVHADGLDGGGVHLAVVPARSGVAGRPPGWALSGGAWFAVLVTVRLLVVHCGHA